MTIPYLKIILLFTILTAFSHDYILADDTVVQPTPLSYKPKFHITCINGNGSLLYTNVICPENWDDYHRLDKQGAAISSIQESAFVADSKLNDKNPINDSINVAPSNSEGLQGSSASVNNETTQSISNDSRVKTQHVRSYTKKDGTVVRSYDRRPPK